MTHRYKVVLIVLLSLTVGQIAHADDAVMTTGSAGPNLPGSLRLQIGDNGRLASQNTNVGLWRFSDTSSSIFDGSLLIAHGAQGADPTVFLKFYDRASNGQNGFVPVGGLTVDSSDYGTLLGCATATAQMMTSDAVVGVQVEWVFPQTPADDELVFARYKIYRHNAATPITNLAIGILIDANAIPALRLGSIQSGATNQPGSDPIRNLVWVGGADTAGHVLDGQNTATHYRSGVAAPDDFEGAIVGNAVSDIQPGGGPTDVFLYDGLQFLADIDMYSVSDTDLYIMLTLDNGRNIAPGETLTYNLVFVSDTISEAHMKAAIDWGFTRVADAAFGCSGCICPCWADPQCDGVRSNVEDVVLTMNVAFRGSAGVTDPGCPKQRTDFDANGTTDVVDAVRVINVAFRGLTPASQYVNPCL